MNAIIWWLKSPWQLRALVFALSFFVCFVAPWLHNQSLLTSRARKPFEEKSETVSVPKAEVPHQDAEAQAKVPAPQKQMPVQERAAPASAVDKGAAQNEQASSKAEAPVQAMQAPVREEQASVPVPVAQAPTPAMQEQGPDSAQVEPRPVETMTIAGQEQVKAPALAPVEIAPAPAMKELAPTPAQVAPLEVEAKVPTEHQQVPTPALAPVEMAPAPAMKELAPTPAQVAPLAVEAKVATEHQQVPTPALAPVATIPVPSMEEGTSAPPPAAVEEAAALSEPKAPARQDQAAVQESAPSAAPKAQPAGGFKIISQSASVIPVSAASSVEKQEFAASTENGGSAEVEVYVLVNKAGRNLRRSKRVVDQSNGRAELSGVLDSDAFTKAAALYDTVACVGLGSRSTGVSAQEVARLIDNRGVQLCGIIARKPYVSINTKLYGLPLGQQMDSARPAKERAQRSLIIIGVRNTKGDLTDAGVQKKMVTEIIRGGKIANFPLSNYSEVASGKELRYIEVKGGNNNRPIKSSAVKPGYRLQQEVQTLLSGRHKRCGAASRTHLVGSKKVSRSHANAETSGRKTHPGCSLFDFPF